jgi:uncharacterized iron-regulated protein
MNEHSPSVIRVDLDIGSLAHRRRFSEGDARGAGSTIFQMLRRCFAWPKAIGLPATRHDHFRTVGPMTAPGRDRWLVTTPTSCQMESATAHPAAPGPTRRLFVWAKTSLGLAKMESCHWQMRSAVLVLAASLGACTTAASLGGWDYRLRGDALVLLGEVHDNAQQHQLRLATLQRAFAAGWRPAIAMEQFDREHQADIDRSRRERPGDAQHLIDVAAPSGNRGGGGWNWVFYRPFVELALRYNVPLIAANLSNADAAMIVRGGYSAVFSEREIAALGLDTPVAPEVQVAEEREIDLGHCHALPRSMWPRMAHAQFARDAIMADVLRRGAQGGGVVLLAGNGHVRHDIGVPRLLGTVKVRSFAVGYLESTDDSTPVSAFDAVVRTQVAERADPCAEFKRRTADM